MALAPALTCMSKSDGCRRSGRPPRPTEELLPSASAARPPASAQPAARTGVAAHQPVPAHRGADRGFAATEPYQSAPIPLATPMVPAARPRRRSSDSEFPPTRPMVRSTVAPAAVSAAADASHPLGHYLRESARSWDIAAQLLESLMNVAFRAGAVRLRASPREPALRRARMCYDHLAGEVGVQFYEALVRQGLLHATPQGAAVTPAGAQWFAQVDIDTTALAQQRRMLCRPCLDWSERRHHLGGALGAALLQRLFDGGWAHRAQGSRVVHFTAKGELALRQWLATSPEAPPSTALRGPEQ